jgi:DNA-binding transcriptional regulator YbjK
MDFEQFKEFMLQNAAQHEAWISEIQGSLRSLANTTQGLVDNQVYLQEKIDELAEQGNRTQLQIEELAKLVIRHVSDPNAHQA